MVKSLHTDELIMLCKKNNQQAQFELYNRYCNAMYNTALPILQDTVLAEEATQEGFIIAFRKLDQYQQTNSFGGWLKKIVVRKSYEYYHQKHKMVLLTEDQISKQTEEETTVPNNDRKLLLEKALLHLKPKDRLLIKLFYLEGYDHKELSSILNISYANCRTRVSRAKNKLTKLLTI